ncbi:MAG: ribonuclease HII [Candidatus Thorarchaeota archaeon]
MATELSGIAGIDEAGRGPVMGPMVVCGVLVTPENLRKIGETGARDSKVMTPRKRTQLSTVIRNLAQDIAIESVTAADIDYLRNHQTMNEIEVDLFVKIVKRLRPKEVYLDAADVKADRFGRNVGEGSGLLSFGCKIVSEHKADAKYPIVSAASIIAKVERDRIIETLHGKFGNFGSGYPSDPKTVEYLEGYIAEGKELPYFVRRSWASVKNLEKKYDRNQSRLDSF